MKTVDLRIACPLLTVVALALHGCGGPDLTPKGPDPTFVPPPCPAKEAPFAKVMNPATTKEYRDCTITTEAEFNSADWGPLVGGDVEGFVKWSAVLPGATASPAAPTNPFGLGDFKMLFMPKVKSDILFKFKKGDALRVTGYTVIAQSGQVTLFATEVAPKAAAK